MGHSGADDRTVRYRDIVNSSPKAQLVIDEAFVVHYANLAYYQMFDGTEDETLGEGFFRLCRGVWDTGALRTLLEAVLPHDVSINGFLMEQHFPVIGRRILALTARRVVRDGAGTDHILITVQDVTKAEMAHRAAALYIRKIDAMMTEVHHRVKNNIASITSMLRIESRSIPQGTARDVVERIATRVESMGALYDLLAVNENTGEVDLKPYIGSICTSIERMAGPVVDGWRITVSGDTATISIDKAISVGAIVNELIANSTKYAFQNRTTPGTISVTTAVRHDELVIDVSDDGIGLEGDAEAQSTGLGMRLVDMYLRALDGKMDRTSGAEGTRCRLTIPFVNYQDEVAAQAESALQTIAAQERDADRSNAKKRTTTAVAGDAIAAPFSVAAHPSR
ncbi:sensor histidine kinase [Acuticoccus mangrovi]|uniref:Blue-light-activated histidine kinase n=1 Tax=Acuticoccus mangrovi TaxID=2796142 RepID=A0A934IEP6_9HYPH|nr:histidine kinase dimerization/phosphoacceptor domain -containing protein [Acuticoccus mangrovi]MBJ3775234.1 PAS domain S-box protein [Acuticoccus mangrovi]